MSDLANPEKPPQSESAPSVVLRAEELVKHFDAGRGFLRKRTRDVTHAVCGVSLELHAGRTLGLVGESGSGKSTLARLLVGLNTPTSGRVLVRDMNLAELSRRELRRARRHIQIVFQDPYSSLNPVRTVGDIVAAPLRVHDFDGDVLERVRAVLGLVGLDESVIGRYPHAFSGGQRQRIGIARALALDPDIVILDEPVSALDVSIQAQIMNLLKDIQERLNVAYLLIAHDLAVVRQFCDDMAVMYMGRIVERGSSEVVYRRSSHPYTRALLSAVPVPDPKARRVDDTIELVGDLPSPTNPPSGCRFRTRCWQAEGKCAAVTPELVARDALHDVACHFPLDARDA